MLSKVVVDSLLHPSLKGGSSMVVLHLYVVKPQPGEEFKA